MELFSQYRGLRRELYILFIGRIMTNMGSMIWPMFTLILSKKLGLSAGEIALYMLIYSVASFPINLIGGKLADKYNKKNIIIVCDCISITAFIYCSLVDLSFKSIVVFALASLFQNIEWPSYDALVADFTTSADRERAYSLSYMGSNLGLVLSPTIGGLLFEKHLDLAFLINGLAIAISTILIFIKIQDVHKEIDNSESGAYEAALDEKTSPYSVIFNSRVIMLYICKAALASLVYDMWGYLMPLDMGVLYEKGAALYGTMTSLNCIIVVCCTAGFTKWFRKIVDARKMLIGESLIVGGYLIFMAFCRMPIMCYVAICIFTFGEIFETLSSSPFLSRRIPSSHRGRISSISNVVAGIVTAVGRTFVGKIYDNNGSASAWTVVMSIGAVVLAILLFLGKYDRMDFPALYKKYEDTDLLH